jgi:hypothetical protein
VACEEGSRQRHSVLLEGASISGKFMDETRLHESIAGDRQMYASQIRSKCQSSLDWEVAQRATYCDISSCYLSRQPRPGCSRPRANVMLCARLHAGTAISLSRALEPQQAIV